MQLIKFILSLSQAFLKQYRIKNIWWPAGIEPRTTCKCSQALKLRKAKHARDTHLQGSFNGELNSSTLLDYREYEAKLSQAAEIICSQEYDMTIGGVAIGGVTNNSL